MDEGRRIFVDVGAHYGETLEVALHPKWGFERIYCLEPSSKCQELLTAMRDRRVIADPRGLSNETREATLYAAGALGASIYEDKHQYKDLGIEMISLVRASEWLEANTSASDVVYLKLNCEGSEADVLDDLLDSPVMGRVRSIYVDFDIRKIPSQAHRQGDLQRRLRRISCFTAERLGRGGNAGVEAWLALTSETFPASAWDRVSHALGGYLPRYLLGKKVLARVLPRKVFWWIGHRVGRQARRT